MDKEIKKWEELSRETVFEKYNRGIEKVVFRLPDGKEGDFYIKKENHTVEILALTEDHKIILVKQFRPGPNEILDDLPGGYIDKDETPEQAAERELLEETGYRGEIQLVTKAYDCAYASIIRHHIVATNCKRVSKQKLEENEFAKVILISLEEFRNLLRSGKNTDIETGYLGLDYLKLL